jgi:hypothetical protein
VRVFAIASAMGICVMALPRRTTSSPNLP